MSKKKLLIITPHLSTGGAPQVTLNKIELLKDEYIIKCVEYSQIAWTFVVQRNKIINLLGDNFHSLPEDKKTILNIIDNFKPDVISFEEFPEFFMDDSITEKIYKTDREYSIYETTHDSSFPVSSKKWFPNKFIFVSAFNGFRYSMYDTPYSIIEYPVDTKEKDQKLFQSKLNLDSGWKHVINVGLFTPRKNQKYIFEIAEKLKDYKIKFHFIGNQADNFKYYWGPLMDNKPKNCVIWYEKDNVLDFLQASDLFFFPSRGDKNNKELNPIAIKEALEYNMPMMMYDLDVYCGKYSNFENITFLTGDIDVDTENMVKVLNPEINNFDDEVIVITTYPNTIKRKSLTVECINSFKKLNRKIILVSHYPVSEKVQEMVDYYIYDKNNLMIPHSFYDHFYSNNGVRDIKININNLTKSNQSLAALINLFNGIKLAKELNFTKVMTVVYDVVLSDLDVPIIEDYFSKIDDTWNCCLSTMNTELGVGIETTSMLFKIDYFLNKFPDIRDGDKFTQLCRDLGCHNFLEHYFMSVLKDEDYLWIVRNNENTILPNSGLGVSSNSEYYSLLPLNDSTDEWMFYFYTYNLDERKLNLQITDSDIEIYNETIIISEQREFFKKINYSGNPLDITVNLYDGDNLYKTETYNLNNQTINQYFKNGHFREKL
jgi:glycosyltransferase involved in cell wall biosynthesis